MCCSPQASSEKGTMLPATVTTAKWRSMTGSVGTRPPWWRSTSRSTRAPRAIRAHATVVGVRPSTATLMNRNDQPQMKARRNRRRTPAVNQRRRCVPQGGFGAHPSARRPEGVRAPPRIGSMSKSLVERRLRQVAGRLVQLRGELAVSNEQLAHLADAADDARLRSLVSETPIADDDRRQTERHAEAMRRHQAKVAEEIARLERYQDELLDRLLAESRAR